MARFKARGMNAAKSLALASTGLLVWAEGQEFGDACAAAYGAHVAKWRALSGVPTEYSPRGHRPDWYWEFLLKNQRNGRSDSDRVAKLQLDDVGYGDSWLDVLFGQAQEGMIGCSVHGGRYWEATVDLPKLLLLLPSSNRSVFLEQVVGITPPTLKDAILAGLLPPILRKAMCVPHDCTGKAIVNRIFPEFEAEKLFGAEVAGLLNDAISADVVVVEELLNWPSLQLDFAIAGLDNCGTTSLHRNLNQHPEIAFSTTSEDFFFTTEVVHRLLPLKSQVQEFNRRMEMAKDKKLQETGIRPRLAGICSPTLFAYGLARMGLALVGEAKVVMSVCDPLGRLERHFMEYRYCHNHNDTLGLEVAKQQLLASPISTREGCFSSASALWEARQTDAMRRLWDGTATSQHLGSMMALFFGRLLPMHRDFLHEPDRTYSIVAEFLGVRYTYPETTVFGHFNAVGGHRTDLCKNKSLVRRLQRQLEPEYQASIQFLRHAGSPVPESLSKRLTRCKSADVLEFRCPGRETAC